MVKKITLTTFLKQLEISFLLVSIISAFFVLLIWKDINYTLSLLSGSFVAYLNFRSTKNDSIKTLNLVKEGLSPEKGIFLYMSKFYLRLFATGIVLFFFIKILKMNAIFILLGLTLIYFQLILISIRNFYLKKLEIV
ncbi:MAG: hypothetical protein C0169_05875 [Thermodesulfobacterium geofontis]|uniref:ATP synthase subunit I n=1 Tax=Thermodesulfobacterium geofontis TaxID=1295609 RepID=A0A2N7Q9L5_9BACT|nr:MAG: hypothetical protein C0169_05875 [Thermodesulfobacterium geofontis]